MIPPLMKKIAYLALLLAALIPAAADAAQGKTATAVITAVNNEKISVRTGANAGYKITNIGLDGLKTTQPAANVETFTLKPWTTITVNNLPAKVTDLKPGMKVSVRRGTDPLVASSIIAVDVPPAQAADATDKTPPEKGKGPKKTSQGVDAYKVRAVGPDTITVAHDGGKKSISYKVHKFTEISVEGKRCQLESVKVGMEVLVIAGTDPTVAASIKAERAD